MPTVTFVSDRRPAPVSGEAAAGELLREVGRRAGLPLWWRCGHGTCGACLVRVSHAGQPVLFRLGRKERNVMIRQGYLPKTALADDDFIDSPDLPRLACHIAVTEDLLISF
ncbi:2Fe-2S iron-sulfur cluster-binding protein [Microvirgula aerodenitrificans]|uniref:2Fe-2S iron-sulfur cluster-binding protein n=1 Tax=Microvirgula aerodenitrificans TaxID=57480 RepID=UPI00248EBFFA|nr:2Fe-2S iron-sulfur cluster-binding protein [Microvirgula aerodenitrificans]